MKGEAGEHLVCPPATSQMDKQYQAPKNARWVTTTHWWQQLPEQQEWVCAQCGSRSKRVDGIFYEHRSHDIAPCEQVLKEDSDV